MPELPDVSLYVTRLKERVVGQCLVKARILSPFLLRSTGVRPAELEGLATLDVFRVGKRIVFEFENELFMAVHLMIAGRFSWVAPVPATIPKPSKALLAAWDWDSGRLSLSEFSSKKRAGVHLLRGREGLAVIERGGIDVQKASFEAVAAALRRQNRTVKRVLTDPSVFDGIGNAYSDEILFHARVSPVRLTGAMDDEEIRRLHDAATQTLAEWTERLEKTIRGFPKTSEVTAFRPDFFVHGKYGQPCLVCGAPIQRIVHAENENNYCARCQTSGKVLADRSLSRLLKDDWPKTIDELE